MKKLIAVIGLALGLAASAQARESINKLRQQALLRHLASARQASCFSADYVRALEFACTLLGIEPVIETGFED